MITREDFARSFLLSIQAPPTDHNLWALVAWAQAEGGDAAYNMLNTTQKMPGSTDYNSVGVQNYTSIEQGIEATAKTLNWGADRDLLGYKPIRRRLRRNAWAYWTLRAVEDSAWGTGGLAVKCLPGVKRFWDHYRALPIGQ